MNASSMCEMSNTNEWILINKFSHTFVIREFSNDSFKEVMKIISNYIEEIVFNKEIAYNNYT